MKNFFKYIIFFLTITLSSGFKLEIKASTINEDSVKINNFIDSCIMENEFPGIQYVVVDKDKVLYEYYGGYSDVKNKTPMISENTLNAFSVTKLITAIAILQLVENGKLKLEDKISDYVVNIPYPNITIREVLTHSSGIPDPVLGNYYIHWKDEHQTFERDSMMNDVFMEESELKFQPGTKISYSNFGYAILGKVIEVISDLSYEEYIQQNVFDKLNLNKELCHFNSQNYSISAKPYIKRKLKYRIFTLLIKGGKFKNEGKWIRLDKQWYFNFPAHGGLIVSAKELSKIFQNLISEYPKLLNKQMIDLFFTEQVKKEDNRLAISWFITNKNGNDYYSHDGGGFGYFAEVSYYPKNEIFIIKMTNNTVPNSNLLNKIDDKVLKSLNRY